MIQSVIYLSKSVVESRYMNSLIQDTGWSATEPGKPMNEIRVMIIDEHLAVRRALAARLASFPNIDVVATARDCREGMEQALDIRPDVVLMELKGKNSYQPEAIRGMNSGLAEHPIGIIVLTSYADDEEQQAALEAGANRYLLKHIDTAKLTAEIEAVAAESSGARPS